MADSHSHPVSVLIIGAGELGTAVIKQASVHPLAKASENSLSVLLRPTTISTTDAAKKAEVDGLRSLGVHLVSGDIVNDTTEALAEIFGRFTTVVGCSGMTGGAGTQMKIAQAILAAKTPRYIPWQFGVEYDLIGHEGGAGLFSEQLDIRGLLRNQHTTDWKIISTGLFMSFIFQSFLGVVVKDPPTRKWKVNSLASWENRVTLTDVEDIGKCTVEVVWRWKEAKGHVIYIAGDTVTYGRLAEVVEDTTSQPIERAQWTVKYLRDELSKDPDNMIKKYRLVFAEGKGLAWDKETSFNATHGIQTMTIVEGARKYLE